MQYNNNIFFDSAFAPQEQLPRKFTVDFNSLYLNGKDKTRVTIDGVQVGDIIDDNSREADSYRFHDVFHFTFASLLGWSPCTRSMLKRKRKSDPVTDDHEDGARATITEESISLMLFNLAKQKDFYQSEACVSSSTLELIKIMTRSFEVNTRSEKEWESAILTGYSLFRELVKHNGGKIHYDMMEKTAIFEA